MSSLLLPISYDRITSHHHRIPKASSSSRVIILHWNNIKPANGRRRRRRGGLEEEQSASSGRGAFVWPCCCLTARVVITLWIEELEPHDRVLIFPLQNIGWAINEFQCHRVHITLHNSGPASLPSFEVSEASYASALIQRRQFIHPL